ncbi:hypothetical protein G352_22486 [Rhodococcus ruber BKS 20-38]|uniref:Uncharacterized protein n=1 Tax=Rhodococcus ruber BKS 20-38 TaxID=1278076 RepID=M2YMA4_9NOCA|nr:hypothetical protein G352_22486 [Rhodococcus ruber BKS 20-38]
MMPEPPGGRRAGTGHLAAMCSSEPGFVTCCIVPQAGLRNQRRVLVVSHISLAVTHRAHRQDADLLAVFRDFVHTKWGDGPQAA